MSSTPQKDMNQVKSKFDSANDVGANHSYQTLDQDTRRVNRPIRGNHHTSGGAGPSQGTKPPGNTGGVMSSKLMANPDEHNGYTGINM